MMSDGNREYDDEKGRGEGKITEKAGEKDELKSQVQKSKAEIENVYNFLFDSMVNLTSARSKETGEHLKRTKEYMKVMLAKYEEFYHENLF